MKAWDYDLLSAWLVVVIDWMLSSSKVLAWFRIRTKNKCVDLCTPNPIILGWRKYKSFLVSFLDSFIWCMTLIFLLVKRWCRQGSSLLSTTKPYWNETCCAAMFETKLNSCLISSAWSICETLEYLF